MISRVLQACYDAHDIRNDKMHKHNRYTSLMPVIIYKSNDYLNFIIDGLEPSVERIEIITHDSFFYRCLRALFNGRTQYPKHFFSLYLSNKTIRTLKKVKEPAILLGEFDIRLLHLTANFLRNTNYTFFWSWNEVSKKELEALQNMGYNISLYDYYAATKFNLKYIHQVYRFAPASIIKPEVKTQEYDCYWLGKIKSRLPVVNRLEKFLLSQKLTCRFIYVYERAQRLSYIENLRNVLNSKCIIDINDEGSFGLSLRVMESIFFNRKLITTNSFIRQCDFYNPNNIFIYGEDKDENIKAFMDLDYQPVSQDILNRYDINEWIGNFLFQ